VTITYLLAGIPVRDRDASAAWYSNLFAAEPMYPNDQEAMWQVVGTGSVYVIVDANAGAGTVTLIVADLDAAVVELRGRGVELADPIIIPGAGRKALVRDPDGNQVWYVGLS
jgi:catechol 2,3-dioxygenase-like lactoylglutathione lyase family enzyme